MNNLQLHTRRACWLSSFLICTWLLCSTVWAQDGNPWHGLVQPAQAPFPFHVGDKIAGWKPPYGMTMSQWMARQKAYNTKMNVYNEGAIIARNQEWERQYRDYDLEHAPNPMAVPVTREQFKAQRCCSWQDAHGNAYIHRPPLITPAGQILPRSPIFTPGAVSPWLIMLNAAVMLLVGLVALVPGAIYGRKWYKKRKAADYAARVAATRERVRKRAEQSNPSAQ